ncbi:MAG: hypothetical protein AAFQ61_00165 [Cyanobacteria bacterium J06626_23]
MAGVKAPLPRGEGFGVRATRKLCYALGFLLGLTLPAAAQTIESIQGGSAFIQQADGSYRFGGNGSTIGPREALFPTLRAQVAVRCPNNRVNRAISGQLSGPRVLCPDVRAQSNNRYENDTLALNNGTFPYAARVIGDSPMLYWSALAVDHRVSLHPLAAAGLLDPVWQTETTETRLIYDGPELDPAITYALVVEPASSRADTLCGEGEVGLTRWRQGTCFRSHLRWLGAEDAERLAAEVAELSEMLPAADGLALALAYRYEAAEVPIGVIGQLEPFVTTESAPAAAHLLLASAYIELGLFDQAEQSYRQARQQATLSRDFHTRLNAKLGLANVAAWQMQPELATRYLWSALWDVSYVKNSARADVIVQLIQKLE